MKIHYGSLHQNHSYPRFLTSILFVAKNTLLTSPRGVCPWKDHLVIDFYKWKYIFCLLILFKNHNCPFFFWKIKNWDIHCSNTKFWRKSIHFFKFYIIGLLMNWKLFGKYFYYSWWLLYVGAPYLQSTFLKLCFL